jgi:hypothetical protein
VKFLKNLFQLPSPADLAARELIKAQRELLNAQTAAEYAHSMCTYNVKRITRLQTQLGDKA